MRRGVLVAAGVLMCFACRRGAKEVVVYTSVDQPFSEPIFKEFEKRSGIKVLAVYDTEETKSTGVVNRLIAEARQPRWHSPDS
jgi:iron(III) transport system substrate-binding protein